MQKRVENVECRGWSFEDFEVVGGAGSLVIYGAETWKAPAYVILLQSTVQYNSSIVRAVDAHVLETESLAEGQQYAVLVE